MYSWAPQFEDATKERVILNKEQQLGSLRDLESKYGKYAVIVTDIQKFFDRLKRYVKRPNSEVVRMWSDLVVYEPFDKIPTTLDEAMEMSFHKDARYSGEREYRFAFFTNREKSALFRPNVGSIRDIAKPVQTKDIYDSIEVNGHTDF